MPGSYPFSRCKCSDAVIGSLELRHMLADHMPLIIDVAGDLADHVNLGRQVDLFVLVVQLHV